MRHVEGKPSRAVVAFPRFRCRREKFAHVVEEASFPEGDAKTGRMPDSWAVHQLRTTVDFARNNRALSWYVGGLNFQAEHHLFPRICHVHYPRIARLVEAECRRSGVAYHSNKSLWSAIRSHYRWVKRMGQPQHLGHVA